MNYKEELIEMVEKMHNITFIAMIHAFAHTLFEKEKNRRGVRRSQLHSVSAGAAKTPYPQPSSSFPNCDRFTGSQFGIWNFTTPHAIFTLS